MIAPDLPDRLEALADELLGDMRCTTPAGNPEPGMHCAACCYGTGYVVADAEDQALLDLGQRLRATATLVRRALHPSPR